jgi:hypothetical protein
MPRVPNQRCSISPSALGLTVTPATSIAGSLKSNIHVPMQETIKRAETLRSAFIRGAMVQFAKTRHWHVHGE